jgi:uncharacterized protein
MKVLQIIAFVIVGLYFAFAILLYILQTRLIFFPVKLPKDFKFQLRDIGEEVFLTSADGEKVNALFYRGTGEDVVLYFHGNAGNLSGWQFVAEDFTTSGYNILIIDYRGYGKSTGSISEPGFYSDAEAAYGFLVQEKGFNPQDIIIYGRSIGTGVAVHLATRFPNKGLVLESAYTSLGALVDDKVPFFFPSLYLKYSFNNVKKINQVKSPVIFVHGTNDTLIPSSHSEYLYQIFNGRKKLILVSKGEHNDLNSFEEYHHFLREVLPQFF